MAGIAIPLPVVVLIFFLVAALYSSVGLGGGSSYTALLAIFGLSAAAIPLVSLSLNVIVTTVGAAFFLSRDHARLRLIAPFLLTSVPMAYVGGMIQLPRIVFYLVLLVSLLGAAIRLYLPGRTEPLRLSRYVRLAAALLCGTVLGLVAGIAGIGGGVYLVPLIILLGLGTAKEAAACGAFFVWVNSVSGLAARLHYQSVDLEPFIPLLLSVLAGGVVGSLLGSGRLPARTMERTLGVVMLVAVLFLGRKILLLL